MWLQLVIVTLLAAIAQGIAGFGFTLLAVSFFLLALRSTDAVQLVILINFAISLVLVGRLWPAVPRRLWALMAAGGLLGFPAGLWMFARADVAMIELAVALVTISFALAVLAREVHAGGRSGVPSREPVEADASLPAGPESVATPEFRPFSALGIGVAAGALTSSLGAPGPPVALYLAGLDLDKTTFRALALSTFMVMQLGSLAGQILYVGVPPRVWGYAAVLVPVSALGAALGHRLCHHVSERAFRRAVLLLLLATGGYMAFRALAG